MATRKELHRLDKHNGAITSVAFGPDSKTLLVATGDGHLVWWGIGKLDRRQEWNFPGAIHGVSYAPDGRHFATANSNGTVYLIRLPRR
jgi:WD40 repeat protein